MGIFPSPPDTSVQMSVPQGPLTETDSPVVTGSVHSRRGVVAYCPVQFYVDGAYSSGTTADANGNFSAVVGPLVGNGGHTIEARAQPYFKNAQMANLQLAFNYVIDPTVGSDSNPGTVSQPWASTAPLNALASIPTGSVIGIRRGSVFHQTLTRSENNISIVGFGSSSAGPVIFDGSATVAANGWTATSGYSNVYQTTVALPGNVKFSGNVWDSQSETALVETTSIANVAATPGTAYCSNWQGTSATIYIQLSDSSNPQTNGRAISYSALTQGIVLTGNNCSLNGITGQRYGHQDGNFSLSGTGSTVSNFQAIGGNRHGALFGPNATYSNAQFISGFDDLEGSANGCVVFAAVVAGMSISTQNNLFDGTLGRQFTGIDYHGQNTSDLYGTVTHTGDTFLNMLQAVTAKASNASMYGPTFTNVQTVVSLAGGSMTVKEMQPDSTLYSVVQVDSTIPGAAAFTSIDNTYTIPELGYGSLVANYRSDVTMYPVSLTINGDVVTIQTANNPYDFIRLANGSVSVQNLTVLPALGNPAPRLYNLGTGVASGGSIALGTIDYNTYPFGTQFELNGTLYTTLAAWRAATGKDLHSTVAQPTPSGADNFQRANGYLDGTTPYIVIGTADQISVSSDMCAFTGTAQTAYAILQSSSNHYIRCTIAGVPAVGGAFPLAVRVIDNNNWIGLRWSSGSKFQVYQCINGTLTSIGGASSVVPAVANDVVFVAQGSYVYIYVNGVNVDVINITATGLLTQKYVGMVSRSTAQNPMLSYLEWGSC